MRKEYLMTPGPTPVPPEVLVSQARPIFHHRTPKYTDILVSVEKDLQYVFQTKNDVLIFAASGTGAMESAVANLFSPGDKVIVTSNGKFGDRMVQLSDAYKLNPIKLEYEWDQVVNPADIEKLLKEDTAGEIKGVLVVQSETSTGILNDVKTMGNIVKDYPAVFVVDSITGLGAVELKTDQWHLDVVMTGSQKGLMLPPGLACVSVSEKAWKAVEKSVSPRFYFSYEKSSKALHKASPTNPFTPPVSLMVGLQEALRMMREEGLENVIKRHAVLAEAVRQGVESIGLELFAPPEGRGNAVTPVRVPEGVDGQQIVKIMRDKYGITIAGGQDHLKGKIFRIGHLGYFDRFDIVVTLAGMEMALYELGYLLELGTSVATAQRVFMDNPL